ncbi:M14 family zinc carboxypeptidase [Natrinema salifodinae]|uniref:Zinc carboxypeptidase n=1 Tax=Natrinema salifodinae TaxID=1202768 RepID=A0A1I0QMZ8_9EURY|nr:M14 family zinc carboxypeptidase [Natrinema salifodinae]SEW28150.1 Zinc carboxypeptidase [Natrinema salifodinae]
MEHGSHHSQSNRSADRAADTDANAVDADPDAGRIPTDTFADSTIDRRTFLSLSAATGAALALPGAATADVGGEPLTDEYAFVVNHTPDEYAAATVIEFADQATLESFADEYEEEPDSDRSRAPKAVTRQSPTPAAHAHLTADEVAAVLELEGVELMAFSPGANPWWKLEEPYADGVFPPVEAAREFISYRETGQGLAHLEAEFPDRVRVHTLESSPGWPNRDSGDDPDPQDIYVVDVATDVRDEASFAAKEKVVYSLSIHGDERAGVETGARLLEDLARGDADDFEGLLDEIAFVFVFTNPDGWVSREPQFEIPWGETQTNFRRGNAAGVDTNRQYPTMGWIDPAFWPAEPEGAPEVRPGYEDEGLGYEDVVPDSLAIVDHFREYETVEYLCDYHGMYTADHVVFNLETNAPFDHDGTHDLDEVNIRIGEGMADRWGGIEELADDIARAGEEQYGVSEYVPDGLFDYGTVYDSLAYQVTGAFFGWAGQPEAFGGLGAVTVAPEIIFANHYPEAAIEWKPYIERRLVTAYRISMREFARMTAADTDATVATGGRDTAYVTTDELTRSSADLPYTDEQPGNGTDNGNERGRGRRSAAVRRRHDVVRPGPRGRGRASVETEATDASHSLSVQFSGLDGATDGVVRITNPAGTVVHEIDLAEKAAPDPESGAPGPHDFEGWFRRRPEAGQWSVEVESDADVEVELIVLDAEDEYPDPREVLGYEQREYAVNPMQFFADLSEHLEDGSMDGLRVHDVRIGRLLRGNSGKRRYDKLVVSHDVGIDDPQYVAAIEDFVAAGGDLVLTDAGVNLLGALDVGDAATIEADDVETVAVRFANLEDRDFDHPLLDGIRPRQQELWKGPQLGYTTDVDQPATVVDGDAFAAAGGQAAGTTGGGVSVGTLAAGESEITVLGSILPPAQQTVLHPFGMADYSLSFMGHTLVCNALGFEQRRYREGELIRTYGEIR